MEAAPYWVVPTLGRPLLNLPSGSMLQAEVNDGQQTRLQGNQPFTADLLLKEPWATWNMVWKPLD